MTFVPAGTWVAARRTDGARTAWLVCPKCSKAIVLGKCHAIASDGTVSPSFVCTHAGCTFHEFIVLENWSP